METGVLLRNIIQGVPRNVCQTWGCYRTTRFEFKMLYHMSKDCQHLHCYEQSVFMNCLHTSTFVRLLPPLALQPTVACRKMSFHFFLSATNSLHLLTPSTWRSLSTSSFYPFLGFPLLVPSSSWVKIFLGILSSSILSRWPNQLILCPFIHFTIFFTLTH